MESKCEPPANLSVEQSGIFTPTLNMMGWQQNALDDYLTEFIDNIQNSTRPVLEVGAAYGFVSKHLLNLGLNVMTNDLEKGHLDQLHQSLPPEMQQRLTCLPGNLVDLSIEPSSLGGILAARVLQFMEPNDIRQAFSLFYNWMAPNGILCVTNTSPYRGTTPEFVGSYQRKQSAGEEWPGIYGTDALDPNRQKRINIKTTGYRFDPEISRREAELAGFRVLKCGFYSTPFLPDEYRSADGKRDAVGLLAVKE